MNISPESILWNALQKSPGAERQAYLALACGADVALRQEIDALLAAHSQAGEEFLAHPPGQTGTYHSSRHDSPLADGVGRMVGPYKLLQKLGEGGMGAVYLAEQAEPVRRKVAVKLIKA